MKSALSITPPNFSLSNFVPCNNLLFCIINRTNERAAIEPAGDFVFPEHFFGDTKIKSANETIFYNDDSLGICADSLFLWDPQGCWKNHILRVFQKTGRDGTNLTVRE